MEGSAKETVIIVHGTWAAPEAGASRWYQPVEGVPAGEGFVSKLDAALQERGSPARCWAHCTQGNQFFHWFPGENSWIARTHAASALGDYVANLRKEGWRCHIVAHSHGGNVVIEALPQIITPPNPNGPLGKIVTLGTPFIDTMSPILRAIGRRTRILTAISWFGLAFGMLLVLMVFSGMLFVLLLTLSGWPASQSGIAADRFAMWLEYSPIIVCIIVAFGILSAAFSFWKGRTYRGDFWGAFNDNIIAQRRPQLLVIGSLMDETWQILHHMGNIDNPLAVGSTPLSYLFSSMRSNVSQRVVSARIYGAKSYSDLTNTGKVVTVAIHLFALIAVTAILYKVVVWYKILIATAIMLSLLLLIAMFFTWLLGANFFSAMLAPYRWCAQRAGSLANVFPAMVTYGVRHSAWSVLLKMVMGLEGYRYKVPPVEQYPTKGPQNFVKYEHMPKGAEQRALDKRNAWIARHLGDVSQTFSKLAITAADITSLLRTVEDDQTLVHAAYYTDDECIARIADWIADKG
jgi:hypothetical protein